MAPKNEITNQLSHEPARKLAQQYNAITLGGAFALLTLVTVLFSLQFRDLKQSQLARMSEKLNDRGASLDALLGTTSFYVRQLRYAVAYQLRQDITGPDTPLEQLPQEYENQRYFSIDKVPDTYSSEDIGNLFGLGPYRLDLKRGRRAEIRAALSLFTIFKATHQSLPNIAQSYYQSINGFTSMFPWTDTHELTTEADLTIEKLINGVLEMDLVKAARPENNPERRLYWTEAYQDPAGRGLMVTHGAPIYRCDTFLGVVGTDITLGAIDHYVDDMGYPEGLMLVVNEYNQVLAKSGGSELSIDILKPLKEVVPSDLLRHIRSELKGADTQELGDYLVKRQQVGAASWSLVFILPRAELRRLSFYGIWGYVAIVLGLCLFLIVVYVLLRRRFVGPALALIDHIRAEAAEGKSHVKNIPEIWQPWFQTVSDTFALKHVTSNLPGAIYQLKQKADGQLQVIFISNAIRELVGLQPDFLMGGRNHWHDMFLLEDLPELVRAQTESAQQQNQFHFQCKVNPRGGLSKWVRFSSNPRKEPDGSVIWEGLILDITKRKLAEEALLASEQRLRSIMDASLFPLVVSRLENSRVVFINDRAMTLFNIDTRKETKPSTDNYWIQQGQQAQILVQLEEQGMVDNLEVTLLKEGGTKFCALMSAIVMTYEGQPCILSTYTDITRRKELENELKRLATTDPLTGANNRRHYMKLGEREWFRAQRGVNDLTVLMMDIDHFKAINDTYGHQGGDAALIQVVKLVMQKIRNIDILGRLGGEEFAVILPNVDRETAINIANRLRIAISRMVIQHEGNTITFTMSIGASQYLEGDASLDVMMLRADQALYEAKANGRNRVVIK